MRPSTLDALHGEGLITAAQRAFLARVYDRSLFSVHHELRAVLYLGVALFASGVGLLVYQHIDTIGHQVLIGALSLLTGFCFWYTGRQRPPYSNGPVASPGNVHDFVLLLGCLLLATVVGYLQFQYAIFGEHWGLGALLPALACLWAAYAFDHRGVLSLGIAGLAGWLGLTVSPVSMLDRDTFADRSLITIGLAFGAAVCVLALALDRRGVKRHFTFTALSLGAHVLFVAGLAALFTWPGRWLTFACLLACCAASIAYARRAQSFMFLLIPCVYGYIGLTYMFAMSLRPTGLAIFCYFAVSGGAIIYLLLNGRTVLGRS